MMSIFDPGSRKYFANLERARLFGNADHRKRRVQALCRTVA